MAQAQTELGDRDVQELDRNELIDALLNFHGRVKLDFNEAFLAKQSSEHLRHILLAARTHLIS